MDTPVLIVGGGPVGLTLALVLAKFGVNCTLIERNRSTTQHPKMDITNGRSMEIFRLLGIADRISAAAVPQDICLDVAWVSSFVGYEIHRFHYPSPIQARKDYQRINDGTLAMEPDIRISQIVVEPLLRDAALESPHVTLRYGCELVDLEQDGNGVTARVKQAETGARESIRAQYLAGCDGANSRVRQSIGIQLSGQARIRSRYSVHFRSADKEKLEPFGPAWHYQSPIHGTLISQDGKNRYTLHAFLLPHETRESVDPYTKVRDFVGVDFDFELIRAMHWDNNLLVADSYRRERVLLAGDACHQYIPTGGYGMNTGVCDALDSGWKLAGMIQGWGGEGLLDSVETERRTVALRNLEGSKRHAGVRMAIGEIWPAEIESPDSKGEACRAELAVRIADFGNAENHSRGIEIGYGYRDSNIICHGADDEQQDDPVHYTPTTSPGYRPPAIYLHDGTPIFDLFGPNYSLLQFAADNIDASEFEAEAARRGLPLRMVEIRDEHAERLYGYNLVLLRPDHHVAWRGQDIPDNVATILATVSGN